LFFIADVNQSRSWAFIYSRKGKTRELGLGAYPAVSLQLARDKAAGYREMLAKGLDPKEEKERSKRPAVEPGSVTFGEAMEQLLAKKAVEWSSGRNVRQIDALLRKHCVRIVDKPAEELRTQDVLDIVQPVYSKAPVQGSRLLGLIEATIETAFALADLDLRHRPANVARWRGHMQRLLPKRKKPENHAALHYRDLPEFIVELRGRQMSAGSIDVAAFALDFLILTGARTAEVLGARWGEINLEQRVWDIPGPRMKSGRRHLVPLADDALAILGAMPRVAGNPFIFPGRGPNRGQGKTASGRRHSRPKEGFAPLTAETFRRLLRRMGRSSVVPHGFRSSLRDFAGNETKVAREVAEAALAHVVGDRTEQAYRREDALERRRELMDLWAGYLSRGPNDNVVKFPVRA
jgi:integrase